MNDDEAADTNFNELPCQTYLPLKFTNNTVVDRLVNWTMNLQTSVYRTLKLPTRTAISTGAKSELH